MEEEKTKKNIRLSEEMRCVLVKIARDVLERMFRALF